MSVMFGKCSLDDQPVSQFELDEIRPLLAPYGPDGEGHLCQRNLEVLYRAFHTDKESRSEIQPRTCSSGAVVTWDGRLDNREELVGQLSGRHACVGDLEVVVAAYERWGSGAFAKLIGDWALSIWEPKERSLILAKDFLGTRQLYYSTADNQVTWCTLLDPLVRLAARPFEVEQEYLAGWLGFFPSPELTPYVGIHAVRPSSFVCFNERGRTVRTYWEFDPSRTVSYGSDAQYEEHFLAAFRQSVSRRLRSDAPILAELSGGMDSSSIVCVADDVMESGKAQMIRLETISYYSDSEPDWDESPYFAKVEAHRGSTGCHIQVHGHDLLPVTGPTGNFPTTPAAFALRKESARRFSAYLASSGHRVVLSGIGGDEVLGGVPTPIPELSDQLAGANVGELGSCLRKWALHQRRPWFHLLWEVLKEFFPSAVIGVPEHQQSANWLSTRFAKQHRSALTGYQSRLRIFGARPSFQENISALASLQRQLGCSLMGTEPPYEMRYPYLDRDLLEFLYAIPREQLLRPGQRRSLMRRALVGIVPPEILNRKRKAFVCRSALKALSAQLPTLRRMSGNMICNFLDMVDHHSLLRELQRLHQGKQVPLVGLIRLLETEHWLRSAIEASAIASPAPAGAFSVGLRKPWDPPQPHSSD